MRNTLFMNQALITVLLDGVPMIDFMSGDSVRIIPNTEGSTLEVGFDSTKTLLTTNASGTAEFDFKPTSPSLDYINNLARLQRTALGRLFNVQILTSAAEPIRLEGCSISSPGTISSGGTAASARTVVLNVERIIPA